ncbi:TAP-like protein-domain-containing protein [Plectosphaerella cucumerina]|uniref:TAP-like protein-domain-containing protein n=1 Tax=Plectosphaerella cucumerina TaxID=40658 RepID=A0A8K0WXJ9_9PEZI|nr:TAP-like protein-domain-containing protein [Plectosphaerella cucumerina]
MKITNSLLCVLSSAITVVAAGTLGFSTPLRERQVEGLFNWSAITPTRRLQYHDCYSEYKCARLKVPLDWSKANSTSCSSSVKWAAIGIVTLPATVPETDPSFGGTILINQGGPGGAGSEFVMAAGKYLQGILDGDRHYEILGFDPRGIALSTPRAECYDSASDRALDAVQRQGMSPVSDDMGLNFNYQNLRGLGELCGEQGPDSIFNHMSTASVARDMLEIVDRVDELRRGNSTITDDARKPGLQYLAVSYGTVLGNTFASMFPGRVERMVLDGVADADDFVKGTWLKNLNDAEIVVDHFYETCFQAGDLCPLKLSSDRSAADIKGRVDSFIEDLEKSPISTVSEGRVRFITSFLLRDSIRRNNWGCESEAGMSVLCGDSAADAGERNISWARNIVDKLEKQSPTTGESWARIPLACSGWKYQPSHVFRGPFGHKDFEATSPEDKPAAPLFILSTRYDHATPLANAEYLSTLYPGSAVLIQEGWGHCALLTSKSKCTAKHLRTYFDTGKVPVNGETCEEDCTPSIPWKECADFPFSI